MSVKQNLLGFLERVDLKWKEVPAFNECINLILNIREDGDNAWLKDSEIKREDTEQEGWATYPGQ